MAVDGLTAEDINQIRTRCQRIAVVGLSPKPHRASYRVAQYLLQQGYEVIPVHPQHKTILDLPCYASLADIPGTIDMVDCFRASEAMPALADEIIASVDKGVKVMWMQLGIVHSEAAAKVTAAGLTVVMDRCPKIEYPLLQRLYQDA
ncbi:MAG TPA: CoA-binding protein [Oceanospirillaceae bacterium]|nr:CoA-binding protein [Oceanospirillaceae bacterium]